MRLRCQRGLPISTSLTARSARRLLSMAPHRRRVRIDTTRPSPRLQPTRPAGFGFQPVPLRYALTPSQTKDQRSSSARSCGEKIDSSISAATSSTECALCRSAGGGRLARCRRGGVSSECRLSWSSCVSSVSNVVEDALGQDGGHVRGQLAMLTHPHAEVRDVRLTVISFSWSRCIHVEGGLRRGRLGDSLYASAWYFGLPCRLPCQVGVCGFAATGGGMRCL